MLELLWNNPISEAKMAKYLQTLELTAEQSAFDVGCGCGEVLIRLWERFQVLGLGIDTSLPHIEEARKRAKGRATDSAVRFVEANAQTFHVEPHSFDVAICLGASHAFGVDDAYRNAIKQMTPMIVPGGLLLIADGFMRRPAPPEYRKILGKSLPDEMTHASNVAIGVQLGLIPLSAWTSTEDEWDDFEWSYQRIIERNAIDTARLAERRQWMDAYLRWGRDTLGYGVYLFRTPHPG